MINCGICGNAFETPDKRQYICEPCLVPPEYRDPMAVDDVDIPYPHRVSPEPMSQTSGSAAEVEATVLLVHQRLAELTAEVWDLRKRLGQTLTTL